MPCNESLRHIHSPTSNVGLKNPYLPQIQWCSTTEALRFALAHGWQSQYCLKWGKDGWCHIEGWEVVKRMQGPCFLYVGTLGKLPNRFKGRRGGVGGSPGKPRSLCLQSYTTLPGFKTTQHNCLCLDKQPACLLTAMAPCWCFSRKTQAAGRKQ